MNKLRQIVQRIIKEETSKSNWIQQQIVEDSAWEELVQTVDPKDLELLGKLIQLLDKKVDNPNLKNIDDEDFDENIQELDFLFPIDDAKDFFNYLKRYIEIVDDNLNKPPIQLTTKIHQILVKYK
jgi:hypothetical protein